MKKYVITVVVFLLLFAAFILAVEGKDLIDLRRQTTTVSSTDTDEDVVSVKEVKSSNSDSETIESVPLDFGELVVDAKLKKEDIEKREENGLDADGINAAYKECSSLYGFSALPDNLKQLYLEMYIIFKNRASDVVVCSVSETDLAAVYKIVMADHPEIYYIDGFEYVKYSTGNTITKIEVSPALTMNDDEIAKANSYIEQYVNVFKSGISDTASDYEKVKYAYGFIIVNTEYLETSDQGQNILSVIVNQQSVCQGYAKTLQYLLTKLGVDSYLVTGYTKKDNVPHAWNIVKMDGEWYYVDCTWGDSNLSGENASLSDIDYSYLGVTTDEILRTHVPDNTTAMPVCSATKDNYYYKEGAYFDSLDGPKLKGLFNSAYATGQSSVTIKCANSSVYSLMIGELIDGNKIFDYLESGTSNMRYYVNEDLYIITFIF